MKKSIFINLILVGISLTGFFHLITVNEKKKEELIEKQKEILKLWDDKIAEHQFLVNVTYRNSSELKGFFDKLDGVYDKLRRLIEGKELTESEKKEMIDYLMNDFAKTGGFKNQAGDVDYKGIFKILGIETENQIFEGEKLEIVKRLEKLTNPHFITKCVYFNDFDIWEKKENWNLNPGDTTTLMIRLLKNYDLNSHQMELIPSSNLKVIEPYLGEFEFIVPPNTEKGKLISVEFKIFDWIIRDTIVQEIYLMDSN